MSSALEKYASVVIEIMSSVFCQASSFIFEELKLCTHDLLVLANGI